jgi:large subunit ribosomal protein L9
VQNFTIDRRKIQLEEPIKQLGEFKVPVKLHKDVTAEITVLVVKEEEV